jgi:uncharacterized SAM-binding protein YcdF (DUF218 family)
MSTVAPVRPRWGFVRIVGLLTLAGAALLAVFLPFAGRFLVREDPLEKADAVFVLAGSRVERWLEAYDLHRERWSPRIMVSPGPVDAVEARLHAIGVKLPREGDLVRDALLQLGVADDVVRVLPGSVDNTAAEAVLLRRQLDGTGWQRVIVVTSKYHTRRVRFAFRREFAGTPVRIIVRASRHDDSEPAWWWRHRADVRFVTSELQKMAGYALGVAD